MIVVADSGSTKTDWAFIDPAGNVTLGATAGINPFMMKEEEIETLLKEAFPFPDADVRSVYYYGAGALSNQKKVLADLLQKRFRARHVEVHSDLLAAARSLCREKEGIACILGTGSNSCRYDGRQIVEHIPPLGYLLGDEGSGAALGKQLVADVVKKQLPEAICQQFFETYRTSVEEIVENVYKKPFPNRYLARYTFFLNEQIGLPEIEALVENQLRSFFVRNVMPYKDVEKYPVHFTGSVAFVFRKQLIKTAESFGLQTGILSKTPLEGLIVYHQLHSLC